MATGEREKYKVLSLDSEGLPEILDKATNFAVDYKLSRCFDNQFPFHPYLRAVEIDAILFFAYIINNLPLSLLPYQANY